MGGYFSQLVISALYPVLAMENAGLFSIGEILQTEALGSPLDGVGVFSTANITAVDLIPSIVFVVMDTQESAARTTNAEILGIDLVTPGLPIITDVNSVATFSDAAITSTLVTVLFIYLNIESAGTFTTAEITAIDLI